MGYADQITIEKTNSKQLFNLNCGVKIKMSAIKMIQWM